MPCYDPGFEPRSHSVEYIHDPEVVEKVNKLTRILCHVLRVVAKKHPELLMGGFNDETMHWWIQHVAFDKTKPEHS